MNGPRSPWPVPALTEPLVDALGASGRLNALGRSLSNTFYRFVKRGRLKDLLAGTWMAHPTHPMLTDVTIGAWTSAAVLDLVGGERSRAGADTLVGVGILSAIPTALTGLSELTDIVDDQERSIATAHAAANVGGLALWSASWLARKAGHRGAGVAIGMVASAVSTAAGFLGGHLSYRLGVGVDQTAFDRPVEDWTPALADAELVEGRPRRVTVSGVDVFVLRTDGSVHALANRCSHRGGPLHKGRVDEDTVTCPWHLSTFRLDDGSVVRGPATAPQPGFDVRVREGMIEVRSRRGAEA